LQLPGIKIVQLVDWPEPSISKPEEIKVRGLRVGICGTDRAEAAGGRQPEIRLNAWKIAQLSEEAFNTR